MKFKILPIKGDASYRKFYRVILNKKSQIIILAKKDKYKNLAAYSAISKFLRINGININQSYGLPPFPFFTIPHFIINNGINCKGGIIKKGSRAHFLTNEPFNFITRAYN